MHMVAIAEGGGRTPLRKRDVTPSDPDGVLWAGKWLAFRKLSVEWPQKSLSSVSPGVRKR